MHERSAEHRSCVVGGKSLLLGEPYEAAAGELVGREQELRMLTAAWLGGPDRLPMSPLLLGEPGVGKNRLVYEMARRTGKELYIFQGHDDVTPEDLAVMARFSDAADRRLDYLASPLVTAMLRGGICFVDEIAKIRPRALAPLSSVLDERRYIDSALLGERVHAAPGFRFVAATNTRDLEGNLLPAFIRSRLRPVLTVGDPSDEEIERILATRYTSLHDDLRPLMDRFWELWAVHADGRAPTPRCAIHLFGLAMSIADRRELELAGEVDGPDVLDRAGCAEAVTSEDLEEAFRQLLDDHPGEVLRP